MSATKEYLQTFNQTISSFLKAKITHEIFVSGYQVFWDCMRLDKTLDDETKRGFIKAYVNFLSEIVEKRGFYETDFYKIDNFFIGCAIKGIQRISDFTTFFDDNIKIFNSEDRFSITKKYAKALLSCDESNKNTNAHKELKHTGYVKLASIYCNTKDKELERFFTNCFHDIRDEYGVEYTADVLGFDSKHMDRLVVDGNITEAVTYHLDSSKAMVSKLASASNQVAQRKKIASVFDIQFYCIKRLFNKLDQDNQIDEFMRGDFSALLAGIDEIVMHTTSFTKGLIYYDYFLQYAKGSQREILTEKKLFCNSMIGGTIADETRYVLPVDWHRYYIEFEKAKVIFNTPGNSLANQRSYTEAVTRIIRKLSVEIYNFIGEAIKPPCDFTIMGIGSIVRGTMTPTSDLDCAILVSERTQQNLKQLKEYFNLFIKLLNLSMTFMDGITVDSGDVNLIANGELINTTNGYLHRLTSEIVFEEKEGESQEQAKIRRAREFSEKMQARYLEEGEQKNHSIRRPIMLLSYENGKLVAEHSKLLGQYQTSIAIIYEENHKDIARASIHNNKIFFAQREMPSTPLDKFKATYVNPIIYWLSDMALLHNYRDSNGYLMANPSEIIQTLLKSQKIDKFFSLQLERALAITQRFRTKVVRNKLIQNIYNEVILPLMGTYDECLKYDLLNKFDPVAWEYNKLLSGYESKKAERIYHIIKIWHKRGLGLDIIRARLARLDFNYLTDTYYLLDEKFSSGLLKESSEITEFFCKVREIIYHIPGKDGSRIEKLESIKDFKESIKVVLGGTKAYDEALVGSYGYFVTIDKVGDEYVEKYHLVSDALASFLIEDRKVKSKPDSVGGSHRVLPAVIDGHKLWFKILPENPSMELAIKYLMDLVAGDGIPESCIAKWVCPQLGFSSPVAVLISKDIGTLNLDDSLRGKNIYSATEGLQRDDLLLKISMQSYTKHFIRVLLTNPEDDKANDYFYTELKKGLYKLARIDSERVFFKPDKSSLFYRKLQIKSVLFCMPQMYKNLDNAVLNDFFSLDQKAVLTNWLHYIYDIEQQLQRLFDVNLVKAHFDGKVHVPGLKLSEKTSSNLSAFFSKEPVQELITRMDLVASVIQFARSEKRLITGLDMLKVVNPALYDHYKVALVSTKARRASTRDRYNLVAKHYRVNQSNNLMSNAQIISIKQQKRFSHSMIISYRKNFALNYDLLLRILDSVDNKTLEKAISELRNADKEFLNTLSTISARQKVKLIKDLPKHIVNHSDETKRQITQMFLEGIKNSFFVQLILDKTYKDILNDKIFSTMLSSSAGHLVSLKVSDNNLSSNILHELAKHSISLRKLSLININIKNNRRSASRGSKHFTTNMLHLRNLYLENVDLLTIEINAPVLLDLTINKCNKLELVESCFPNLESLKIAECPKFNELTTKSEKIIHIFLNETPLTKYNKLAGAFEKCFFLKSPIIIGQSFYKLPLFRTFRFLINIKFSSKAHEYIESIFHTILQYSNTATAARVYKKIELHEKHRDSMMVLVFKMLNSSNLLRGRIGRDNYLISALKTFHFDKHINMIQLINLFKTSGNDATKIAIIMIFSILAPFNDHYINIFINCIKSCRAKVKAYFIGCFQRFSAESIGAQLFLVSHFENPDFQSIIIDVLPKIVNPILELKNKIQQVLLTTSDNKLKLPLIKLFVAYKINHDWALQYILSNIQTRNFEINPALLGLMPPLLKDSPEKFELLLAVAETYEAKLFFINLSKSYFVITEKMLEFLRTNSDLVITYDRNLTHAIQSTDANELANRFHLKLYATLALLERDRIVADAVELFQFALSLPRNIKLLVLQNISSLPDGDNVFYKYYKRGLNSRDQAVKELCCNKIVELNKDAIDVERANIALQELAKAKESSLIQKLSADKILTMLPADGRSLDANRANLNLIKECTQAGIHDLRLDVIMHKFIASKEPKDELAQQALTMFLQSRKKYSKAMQLIDNSLAGQPILEFGNKLLRRQNDRVLQYRMALSAAEYLSDCLDPNTNKRYVPSLRAMLS